MSHTSPATAADNPSVPDTGLPARWWILPLLSLSVLVVTLDNLVLQVALPTLATDLNASQSQLQWFADAYALVFASTLLFSGSLGDRFGHRRLYFLGLSLFGIASVGAAYSQTSEQLISARVVMALGASLLMPATLSIVQQIFSASERQKAVSIWAGAASIGVPIGPIVGGFLLEHFWWGAVFLINVPIVIVAIVGGAFLIPPSRRRHNPLDWLGAGLVITGLFLLVYGLIEAPRYGWSSLTTLGLLAASLVFLVGFYWWETVTEHPLMPPSLLKVPRFSVTATAIILMAFGLFGVIYILTQYLQVILGYSPLQAGVRLMPIATIAVGSGIGLLLAKRVGTKWVLVGGLLVMAVGQILLSGIGADSEARALWSLVIVGVGLGSLGPASDLLLGAVPPDKEGIGSAMTDTTLQLGGSLGVAVLGSVIATAYTNSVTPILQSIPNLPAEVTASAGNSLVAGLATAGHLGAAGNSLRDAAIQGFLDGTQTSLYIACAITLLGALLAATLLPGKKATAEA